MSVKNVEGPAEPYGFQQTAKWDAGDDRARPLCQMQPAKNLWQVTVIGGVTCDLIYGTLAAQRVSNLVAPLFFCAPGKIEIQAVPVDASSATIARVCVTPVSAGGALALRQVLDATSGAVEIGEHVHKLRALSASNVTVAGIAIPLAAGEEIQTVIGSTLNSGTAIAELSL